MNTYLTKHHKILGVLGAIAALSIAVIYFYAIPEAAATASTLPKLILTYGHSLCWALIAIASLLWATTKQRKYISLFGYSALVVYGVFLFTLLANTL